MIKRDKASLSPSSLTKHMFGDSADEVCEVLTPSQCVNSTEPVRHITWRRRCPTEPPPPSSDTAAPVVTFIPPASIVPKMDAEFVNARFVNYMRIVKKGY